MDSSSKDKVEGKLKEAEGKITGDDTRETQGKLEQKKGDLKDKVKDGSTARPAPTPSSARVPCSTQRAGP